MDPPDPPDLITRHYGVTRVEHRGDLREPDAIPLRTWAEGFGLDCETVFGEIAAGRLMVGLQLARLEELGGRISGDVMWDEGRVDLRCTHAWMLTGSPAVERAIEHAEAKHPGLREIIETLRAEALLEERQQGDVH